MDFPFAVPDGDLDVLCIGECLVDLIAEDDTAWLREVETFRRHAGGSPANIATYVAKLGGRAAIVAKTGIGAFGTYLKGQLRAAGVEDEYLVMDHRVHTSIVFVSRSRGTPEFEAFRQGDYLLEPAEVPAEAVARARLLHASTFALSRRPSRDAVERAFDLAEEHGAVISLDPNYSPVIWPQREEARTVLAAMLARAHLSKPSLDDCRRFFDDDATPEDYVARFHELGPPVVVLTMGQEGVLLSVAGQVTHVPTRVMEVRDATAAGDAFWAGFLVAMLDGLRPEACVLAAREVVARKLAVVGHVPGTIDRSDVYGRIS